jgi:hypothetical protein
MCLKINFFVQKIHFFVQKKHFLGREIHFFVEKGSAPDEFGIILIKIHLKNFAFLFLMNS